MADIEKSAISADGKVDYTPVVIVVDDVEDVRNYIKRLLEHNNLKLILCKNGKELMDIVTPENAKFDLILLDLSMPDMNGLEVLAALQEFRKKKTFKVCVLSGYNDQKIIHKASDLKADDFLTKPFDKDIFLNRVRNLLKIESGQLKEFAFVKVHFAASITNLPILVTFYIVGVTEEGVLLECAANFRENSILTFSSKAFCEAVGCDQEFNVRVLKSQHPGSEKYLISTAFFSMPESVAGKIRAFTVWNAKTSSSVFR